MRTSKPTKSLTLIRQHRCPISKARAWKDNERRAISPRLRTAKLHIISSDLFHLWEEHVPRHSRIYTDLIPIMEDVISRYMKDVVARAYPAEKETVFMSPEECLAFATEMKWDRKIDELSSQQKKTA